VYGDHCAWQIHSTVGIKSPRRCARQAPIKKRDRIARLLGPETDTVSNDRQSFKDAPARKYHSEAKHKKQCGSYLNSSTRVLIIQKCSPTATNDRPETTSTDGSSNQGRLQNQAGSSLQAKTHSNSNSWRIAVFTITVQLVRLIIASGFTAGAGCNRRKNGRRDQVYQLI